VLLTTAAVALLTACAFAQNGVTTRRSIHNPIVDAVKAASPAVVNISTEKVVSVRTPDLRHQLFDDKLFDEFFERYEKRLNVRKRSLGSGVLFDHRGYIVTNEHVVGRASKIQVTLYDKTTYFGTLISTDHTRDLAVIKISRPAPFPVIDIYRREELMIGETAIAIGNPFGFEHTVTAGVVSAVGRNVQVKGEVVMRNLLQTDASINPGNSGGALVDINGDLIGINTAIRSGAEGIGFAIPFTELRQALVDLLDFRRLSKVYVGLGLVQLVKRDTNEPVGLRVIRIQPDSPAVKAGFAFGDVVTKLNGRRCVDVLAFEIDVLEHKPGDTLVFEGVREGRPFKLELALEQVPVPDPNVVLGRRLGLAVRDITRAEAMQLGIEADEGVLVTKVGGGSPAAAAGVRPGDVILIFSNFRVSDAESLASGVSRVKSGERTVVLLLRQGYKYRAWVRVR
jgi:serine protease Do